jgi:hypothetical protein
MNIAADFDLRRDTALDSIHGHGLRQRRYSQEMIP